MSIENRASSPVDPSTMSLVEIGTLPRAEMVQKLSQKLEIDIMDTNFADLLHILGNENLVLTDDGVQQTIDQYRLLYGLEDQHPQNKAAQLLTMTYFYSNALLPALTSIRTYGLENNDRQASQSANLAIMILLFALKPITESIQKGDSLTQIRVDSEDRSNRFSVFKNMIYLARVAANECITDHGDKAIVLPPEVHVPKQITPGDFESIKKLAMQEFDEAENGIDYPAELKNRIRSAEVVVVSLDWNSVLTINEDTANTYLISRAADWLRILADEFTEKYPDKKLVLTINSGRPGSYVWQAASSLGQLPNNMYFCIAELGGVVVDLATNSLAVQIEKADQLKSTLTDLQGYITRQVKNSAAIAEPKETMLSMRIQEKNDDSGKYIYQTLSGETVTPDWVQKQISAFYSERQQELKSQLEHLKSQLISEEAQTNVGRILAEYAAIGADGREGTADELSKEESQKILDALTEKDTEIVSKMMAASTRISFLQDMNKNYQLVFNAVAGFVDYCDQGREKFSTLYCATAALLEKLGVNADVYNHHKVLFLHYGDSGSDNPDNKNLQGKMGKAVKYLFLGGVANSTEDLKQTITKRQPWGKVSSRQSVLGLMDFIKGLIRVVKSTQ